MKKIGSEKTKIEELIVNACFLSVVFMYFQLTPISAETQPILILLAIPIMAFIHDYKHPGREDWLLLCYVVVVTAFSLIPSNLTRVEVLVFAFKFLFGPLSYYFVFKNIRLLKPYVLDIFTAVLILTAILSFFPIPSISQWFKDFLEGIMGRTFFGGGDRGIALLTPEPSYFVYFAVLVLFSADYLMSLGKISSTHSWALKGVILVLGLLTKSAIVYLLFLLYAFTYVFRFSLTKIPGLKGIAVGLCFNLALLTLGSIFMYFASFKLNNRFSEIVEGMRHAGSLADLIFYSDASAGYRFLINTIYLLSIFLFPLGAGFGGLREKWQLVGNTFHIEYWKNGVIKYQFKDVLDTLDAQSMFPNAVATFGVFSIFLFLFFYSNLKFRDKHLKNAILFVASLFLWIVQSNFVNPVFWILLAFCKDGYSIPKVGTAEERLNALLVEMKL